MNENDELLKTAQDLYNALKKLREVISTCAPGEKTGMGKAFDSMNEADAALAAARIVLWQRFEED